MANRQLRHTGAIGGTPNVKRTQPTPCACGKCGLPKRAPSRPPAVQAGKSMTATEATDLRDHLRTQGTPAAQKVIALLDKIFPPDVAPAPNLATLQRSLLKTVVTTAEARIAGDASKNVPSPTLADFIDRLKSKPNPMLERTTDIPGETFKAWGTPKEVK
jgi:hypothetical protein